MSEAKTNKATDNAKAAPKKSKKPARPIGMKTVFVGSVLAALLGALGGFSLTRFALPKSEPVNLSPIETKLADFEKKRASLEARLNRIEATQKTLQEERDTPDQDLDDITARIMALESGAVLENSNFDLTDFSSRLSGLELQMSEMAQSGSATPLEMPEGAKVDLGPLERRVAALEARIESQKVSATRLIPAFPKAAVIAALETPQEAESKGWFGRLIDSQITIVDGESLKTVDEITILIGQGDIDGAVKLIATLPPSAQTAARDWVKSVSD